MHLTAALATGQSTTARFFGQCLSGRATKDSLWLVGIAKALARPKAAACAVHHGGRDLIGGACCEK